MRVFVTILVLALTTAVAHAQSVSIERQIYNAFNDADYHRAFDLIETHLKDHPNDVGMLYNGACALCQLNRPDDAASYLHRAMKAGFRDFDHLRSDPDLAPLREHPVYRRIMEEADKASRNRSGSALEQWISTYGAENYKVERDEERRLVFAVALDETSLADMRAVLGKQADQAIKALFGEAPAYDVLIAVPTPEDGRKFFKNRKDIGGMYEHDKRRLVARDIGGSLQHEFTHVLHYGHMERLRQRHPLWIQEGIASLYETYDWEESGNIRFLPNERQYVVKARVRGGGAIPWTTVMALDGQEFMDRAEVLYPQVQSMFQYLVATDKLADWYKAFTEGFKEDPTGLKAFERVYAKPIEDVERDWRKWVVSLPDVDLRIDPGDAALGIRSRENGANDGVLVTDVLPGSGASRAKVRRGDVVVSMDGQPTRSMIDLRRMVAARDIGEVVELRLRRNNEYLSMPVRLGAMRGGF